MSNLIIKLTGEIQKTNFHDWKNELINLIQTTNMELTSDIDFSSAEQDVKDFKKAEKTLKKAKENALYQAKDIQDLFNAIDEVTEQARQTRLTLERQIKIRKIEVKEEIALKGIAKMQQYIEKQSDDFKISDISRFVDKSIFLSKIKGTRGTSGAELAINQLCDQFKNEITLKSSVIQSNASIIDSIPLEHSSLFQDRSFLLDLLPNNLNIIIDERIDKYHSNQKLINQSHAGKTEAIADIGLDPVELENTKKIISDLLMKTYQTKTIKALTICLRLIEDEINRNND
jgi:hypothetical protein